MLERLKIKYVFEEKSHPDKDMKKFMYEIKDNYFDDWLEEVFFAEFEEEGENWWEGGPETVIKTFIDTNKEQISQHMSDLQKKIFFHPQTQEKFKDVLIQ